MTCSIVQGEKLRQAIKDRGWTQKQAANFLGIHTAQVSNMINGRSGPPYLFTRVGHRRFEAKIRRFKEAWMDLTGQTVEQFFATVSAKEESVVVTHHFAIQPIPTPDQELIEKELEEEIMRVLKRLPEYQRSVFCDRFLEGEPLDKIAQKWDKGVAAISAASIKAYRLVKRMLKEVQNFEDALCPS